MNSDHHFSEGPFCEKVVNETKLFVQIDNTELCIQRECPYWSNESMTCSKFQNGKISAEKVVVIIFKVLFFTSCR